MGDSLEAGACRDYSYLSPRSRETGLEMWLARLQPSGPAPWHPDSSSRASPPKGSTASPEAAPHTGGQVFKHSNLWGHGFGQGSGTVRKINDVEKEGVV